jgi:D-threo-aldose 1-dehydrogenase
MRTHPLRGGGRLTELGLGMAQFGNLYRETTDDEVAEALEAAWDAGIRYYDTAPHYGLGLSERRAGAILAQRPRDEFTLSTKVGRILEPSPETADRLDSDFVVPAATVRRFDFSRDGILRSVEESLIRLGLDRIDILYLHDPDDHLAQAFGEGAAALIELREQGVVRAVGAGMNHAAPLAELIRRADVDLVMCAGRYTLLDQEAERELLPLALERGVGVVAAGIYNSGLLSQAAVPDDARYDYDAAPAALLERARAIARVCAAHGVTLPDAAVAFPMRHPAVVSTVVGARTRRQVEMTIERADAAVPEALWDDLDAEGLVPHPPHRRDAA